MEIQTKEPTFNYTQNATEWAKYQDVRNLRLTDIAKLIRKDLKVFPKWYKFSVKTSLYSGWGSIDVSIIESPFTCYSKAYKEYQETKNYNKYREYCEDYRRPRIIYHDNWNSTEIDKPESPEYTMAWENLIKWIEKIVRQYNFSDCDWMIDYFHVNFYSNVSFHWEKFKDSDNLHPCDTI